jgi:hypothetical protein
MTMPIIGWKVPKRYAHYLLAVIQSGFIAAIASYREFLSLADFGSGDPAGASSAPGEPNSFNTKVSSFPDCLRTRNAM